MTEHVIPEQATPADVAAAPMPGVTNALSPVMLWRLGLGLVGLGVLWRLVRYGLSFPIWADEAFVCLNFLDQDYASLTGPLKYGQVAPLLFLWAEQAAYQFLGRSELSLRLLPFLAGLASLALSWRLAWRTLPPLAAALAVGLLAVAYFPVGLSCTVKPYSLDLLMALALLVPAVECLYQPHRWVFLAVLTVICPLAIFSSFPAVFVAGAVSLALWPTVWRQPGWVGRGLYVAFNLGMLTAFLIHFGVVGLNQLDREDGSVNAFLQDFLSAGFPPSNPWEFGKWFVLTHTGLMCAYPVGDRNGGSVLTTLLILAGLVQLIRRQGVSALVVLLLAPFVLNFIAACIHKYPYGGECYRLSQHLAPATCMLAGLGLAWCVQQIHSVPTQRRVVLAISACLAVIPLVGIARDFSRPYKQIAPYQARGVLRYFFAQVQPNDTVVVLNAPMDLDAVSMWTLVPYGDRIHWNGEVDPALLATTGQVWVLRFRTGQIPEPKIFPVNQPLPPCSEEPTPAPGEDGYILDQKGPMSCDIYRWTRVQGAWCEAPRPDLSSWSRPR